MFFVNKLERDCGFITNSKNEASGLIVDYFHYSKYYNEDFDKFKCGSIHLKRVSIRMNLSSFRFSGIGE